MVSTVKHPAKYSKKILETIEYLLDKYQGTGTVLDPFGGVGGIHSLRKLPQRETLAIEIEPEWARISAELGPTITGDFLDPGEPNPFSYDGTINAVVTSPTYGNRMADHHEAKDDSKRNTYRHTLGRELSAGSSAGLQWGDEYKSFHEKAWAKVWRLLPPDGLFILNCKDHIRKHKLIAVTAWHDTTIRKLGFERLEQQAVLVGGNRQGENGQVRIGFEWVIAYRKPKVDANGMSDAAYDRLAKDVFPKE